VAKLSSVVSEIVFATSASHRSKASELAAETPSVDIESIRDHALYLHLLPVTVNRIQSAAIANTRNAAHPSAVTASEVRTIAYTHRLARLLPVVSSSIDYETAIAHVCLSLVTLNGTYLLVIVAHACDSIGLSLATLNGTYSLMTAALACDHARPSTVTSGGN
jgi:hypothetical protein